MTRLSSFGIRGLCFLLALVSAVLLIMPATATNTQTAKTSSYTSLVYSRASTDSVPLGQLEDGTQLAVLEELGSFYKISCYETNGYILKSQTQTAGGKYYVNCIGDAPETKLLEYATMGQALQMRAALLQTAAAKLGAPYWYGSMGPTGFDCSGYISYVCNQNGISLNRTADMQMQDGIIVSREGLQVGDLVFFRDPGSPWLATHVGMYVGDDRFIHADSRGVIYTPMDDGYYGPRYVGARRLINTNTAQIAQVPTLVSQTQALTPRTMGLRTAR